MTEVANTSSLLPELLKISLEDAAVKIGRYTRRQLDVLLTECEEEVESVKDRAAQLAKDPNFAAIAAREEARLRCGGRLYQAEGVQGLLEWKRGRIG